MILLIPGIYVFRISPKSESYLCRLVVSWVQISGVGTRKNPDCCDMIKIGLYGGKYYEEKCIVYLNTSDIALSVSHFTNMHIKLPHCAAVLCYHVILESVIALFLI